jgi:glycosyltransferase involved in cell wall biosynthesis
LSKPKTIAIFDAAWGGHHNTYLKIYAGLFLEKGTDVWVFCPGKNELTEWVQANDFKYSKDRIAVEDFPTIKIKVPFLKKIDTLSLWLNWFAAFRALRTMEAKNKTKAFFCFFITLDYFVAPHFPAFLHSFLFKRKWMGILFHPKFSRINTETVPSLQNPAYAYYSFLRSKCCYGIGLLDEGICERTLQITGVKRAIVFPDITDTELSKAENAFLKKISEKTKGRRIVGVLGYLLRSKGIIPFIKAAAQCKAMPFYFILAGDLIKQSFSRDELDFLVEFIANNPDSISWHTERIPDEGVFNQIACFCDILFAAYLNFHHSSNILTKAAVFRKPVIVSKGFCMAERVSEYKMGICVEEGNVDEIARAIIKIDSNYDDIVRRSRFEHYAAVHSVQTLSNVIDKCIDPGN